MNDIKPSIIIEDDEYAIHNLLSEEGKIDIYKIDPKRVSAPKSINLYIIYKI
jgi:hypothetical protein